jgi:hypothetical protein
MADYSFSQLEQLWEQAGGPKAVAPVAAAIALAESSGNPAALNKTDNNGTQTSVGLWQVSNGTHQYPQSWTTPTGNATEAVAKYQAGTPSSGPDSFTPWGTYDSGAYLRYLPGGSAGAGSGAASTGGSTGATGGGGNVPTTLSATSPDFLNPLAAIPGLGAIANGVGSAWDGFNLITRDAATVLDRAFGMFKPGQGYRTLAFITAAVAGLGAFKSFQGDDDRGSKLPLTLGLTGLAAMALFMSFRPWPQVGGAAIKPGAYAWHIAEGQVPPEGPPATSPEEVDAIQAGLDLLIGAWLTAKVATSIVDAAQSLQDAKNTIFGWWGDLF